LCFNASKQKITPTKFWYKARNNTQSTLTSLIKLKSEKWIVKLVYKYIYKKTKENPNLNRNPKFEHEIKAAPGETIHKNSSLKLSFTHI